MSKNLIKSIKADAQSNRTKIQSSEAQQLEQRLNSLFLLPKRPKAETEFIKHILTRNESIKERVGLHASSLIASEKDFCLRAQVLSLFYKQSQGEHYQVSLLRIFEEGNSIHEKWQRLFIRAKWANPNDLDSTKYNKKYMISYTPDIVCSITDYKDSTTMIGEIKSVNTFQFQKMIKHPTAYKQLQWYMFLTGIKNGFVLCEDKNTQDIKIEVYQYDKIIVSEFIERAEEIKECFSLIKKHGSKEIPSKPKDCKSSSCKRCSKCNMVLTCWNLPGGRIKLSES